MQDDGSVVISSANGSSTTLPSKTTKNNNSQKSSSADKSSSSQTSSAAEKGNESSSNVSSTTEAQSEASSSSSPASFDMKVEEITSGGTYTLKGAITDTTITIDAPDEDVTLVLSGATIKNSAGPALYVREAGKVTITPQDGTTNTISDGSSYSITDSGSIIDGAIFSKADLKINGGGTLVLNGNCKHGVVSKDDLSINSGTLKVTARNVGLNGKDCVKIKGGNISVNAGSDGIRSNNTSDASRGYVNLYGGTVNIISGNDGVQAETAINIEAVNLNIDAGRSSTTSSTTYKGLKSGSDVCIDSGNINIKMSGDGIDAKGNISINGGSIAISGPNTEKASILDYGSAATISSGSFIGTGSLGAAKNFSTSSKQGAMLVNTGAHSAGETVKLSDSSGSVLIEHTAEQDFSCVIISLASLKSGGTYTLTIGSSVMSITMSSSIYG